MLSQQHQDIPHAEVSDIRPVVTEGDTLLALEKERDTVRSLTTYFFIFLFILTVLIAFYVVIWRNSEWTQTKDLIELLLPAETALIGSAVGFYFGSKSLISGKS